MRIISLLLGLLVGTGAYADVTGGISPPGGSGGGGVGTVTSIAFGAGLTGGTITSSGPVALDLTYAAIKTAVDTHSITLAANTSGDGMILKTPVSAAAASQQYSPRLHLSGQGWATTPVASQPVDWVVEVIPTQGATNPTSTLVFSSATNGGAYSAALSLTSGGAAANVVTFNGSIATPSLRVTGATLPVAGIYSAGSNALSFASSSAAAGSFDTNKNFIHLFAIADQSKSVQVPITGFSITIANNTSTLILDPAGTLAAGTVALPATPIDGQEVTVTSSQIITALTVTSSQTIKNAPTTIGTAGIGFKYIYHLANTTWYRLY
jgi:hypothetical protein